MISFKGGSLARNASWILIGQGLSVVCQAAYFILLARLLGSTEYGIYAGAFATVAILSVYSTLGSQFTLLRHVSANPKEFPLYWGNVLATTSVLGCFFVGVLVLTISHIAHSYSVGLIVCVAIGDCICSQITDASSRVFQVFEKMRITAFLGLLTNLLRTLLAGYLLWSLHHATAQQWVMASLAVSTFAMCAALTLVTKQFGWPEFSADLLRKRSGEGVIFAISSSTSGIYNNFDKAMLGHYGMNAANGVYSMAYRVVDICTMPISSIHAAAFPRFFKKGVGGVGITTPYAWRIVKRTAPMALLLSMAMALTAPIIPHLLGNSFFESISALRWLCLLPVFRSFQYSAGDALTGAGLQKLRFGSQAVGAAFNFGVNLYLIPHYGWIGAAWSSLATDALLGLSNWTVLLALRVKP
jgi:O-antigen/teichoic acid export membrane protein